MRIHTIRRSVKEEAIEWIKRSEPVWLALAIIGASTGGRRPLRHQVVVEILGTGTAADVVYVVIGMAWLAMITRRWRSCGWAPTGHTRRAPDTGPRGPGVHPRP